MNRIKFIDEKIALIEELKDVLWMMKWEELDQAQGRHRLDEGTPERRLSWDDGMKRFRKILTALKDNPQE